MKKLSLYWSMLRYANTHNRDFAREHAAFFDDMQVRLRQHSRTVGGARVLDLGCGKSAWLSILLHSSGAHVTGIDTEIVEPGLSWRKYARIFKANGLERALRTIVWELFYAKPYYNELRKQFPVPLQMAGIDLRRLSASVLDFPDEYFDLVVSHEVLEHLPDVEATAKEIARILKPDGLTYLYVHNYASVSGGHHIAWKYPNTEPSSTVPPWDHLRSQQFPDIPSWINRLRVKEYQEKFAPYLDTVEWLWTEPEGESLLTDEIRQELLDFSETELLMKGFVVIARKKINTTGPT